MPILVRRFDGSNPLQAVFEIRKKTYNSNDRMTETKASRFNERGDFPFLFRISIFEFRIFLD